MHRIHDNVIIPVIALRRIIGKVSGLIDCASITRTVAPPPLWNICHNSSSEFFARRVTQCVSIEGALPTLNAPPAWAKLLIR
jgi:hypothetical protein